MSRHPLVVEQHGSVTLWRLDNPEIRNPLTVKLKAALAEQTQKFISSPDVKALVITGADECFCAGGDLRNLSADTSTLSVRQRMRSSHSWMKLLADTDKPVIMAVNGAAVGAGMSLALSGDIIVASEKAWFMAGFPKVGVLPDLGVLYHLPRAVGLPAAKDILMTNRRVDAQTALSLGLVSRVFAQDDLLSGALSVATDLANGPGVALGLTKSLLNLSHNDTLDTFFLREEAAQAIVFGTEDFSEGCSAFQEKRTAKFIGK